MKPIALAFKNYEINQFTGRGSGELMIVHQCTSCGTLSPNRIAGDDYEYKILSLIEEPSKLDINLMAKIKCLKINIITLGNKDDALISLFGVNYKSKTELN